MNECDICHKTYSNRQNLKRHMETIHGPSSSEDAGTQVSDHEEEVFDESGDTEASGPEEGESLEESSSGEEMDNEQSIDKSSSSSVKQYTPSGAWKYLIALTIEEMGLTNKEQVYHQFKEFLSTLRERVELHVGVVSSLRKDKLYNQLKNEECRWLKRGFSCDEAAATAWKQRKIMLRKMVDHVFATMDSP